MLRHVLGLFDQKYDSDSDVIQELYYVVTTVIFLTTGQVCSRLSSLFFYLFSEITLEKMESIEDKVIDYNFDDNITVDYFESKEKSLIYIMLPLIGLIQLIVPFYDNWPVALFYMGFYFLCISLLKVLNNYFNSAFYSVFKSTFQEISESLAFLLGSALFYYGKLDRLAYFIYILCAFREHSILNLSSSEIIEFIINKK